MFSSWLRSNMSICLCLLVHRQTVAGWSPFSAPTSRRHLLAKAILLTTPTIIVGNTHDVAHAADDKDNKESSESDDHNNANNNEKEADRLLERQQRETRLRLVERRKLMQASRSSNDRQSYLDLSRQRAALYNTTSRAVSCPPNIPCY